MFSDPKDTSGEKRSNFFEHEYPRRVTFGKHNHKTLDVMMFLEYGAVLELSRNIDKLALDRNTKIIISAHIQWLLEQADNRPTRLCPDCQTRIITKIVIPIKNDLLKFEKAMGYCNICVGEIDKTGQKEFEPKFSSMKDFANWEKREFFQYALGKVLANFPKMVFNDHQEDESKHQDPYLAVVCHNFFK